MLACAAAKQAPSLHNPIVSLVGDIARNALLPVLEVRALARNTRSDMFTSARSCEGAPASLSATRGASAPDTAASVESRDSDVLHDRLADAASACRTASIAATDGNGCVGGLCAGAAAELLASALALHEACSAVSPVAPSGSDGTENGS